MLKPRARSKARGFSLLLSAGQLPSAFTCGGPGGADGLQRAGLIGGEPVDQA
ncbi:MULTISPECIES: hypothetical protein [Nonomuraea]|uniref:Uncharacterized protein n=1 Tax=Nonomuraea salmonea TaxID=46181 RepID=A0ABV5P1H0_9ACTN